MIGRLEGHLHRVDPGKVLIDVGGVGYLVSTTLRAFQALAGRDEAALWIHTQVRGDAIDLYGFPDRNELEAFSKLIAVAGVGPRTALAVLTGLTADELAEAVEASDLARLQRTPGVGRKTAERILLELKGRLLVATPGRGVRRGDAVSALVNLGYPQRDDLQSVDEVWSEAIDGDLGDLLRLGMQKLTR